MAPKRELIHRLTIQEADEPGGFRELAWVEGDEHASLGPLDVAGLTYWVVTREQLLAISEMCDDIARRMGQR